MDKLKSSYITKAVIFPVIVVAILIVIAIMIVPGIINALPRGTDAQHAVKQYNADDYYLVNYNDFDDLRLNNFIGWLSSEDIALGCALTYKSENEDTSAASVLECSTEPWNNGKLLIIGDNTDKEFRNLHKANNSDEFTIEFHKHDAYTYAIKKIVPIASSDELKGYMDEGDCVLCLPYNDFSQLGSEYFYTVYVAEMVE